MSTLGYYKFACCNDADTTQGQVYLRVDTINFKPWKSADTIQGHGQEKVILYTIIHCSHTINIDAHAVTNKSHGGHYLSTGVWILFKKIQYACTCIQ